MVEQKEAILNQMKTDYDDAIKTAQEFEETLKKTVEQERAKIAQELRKQSDFEYKMLEKDKINEARLRDQVIQTQITRISELEQQLKQARETEQKSTERVQQIAEKAIENAAKNNTVLFPNQNSLSEVYCTDNISKNSRK